MLGRDPMRGCAGKLGDCVGDEAVDRANNKIRELRFLYIFFHFLASKDLDGGSLVQVRHKILKFFG